MTAKRTGQAAVPVDDQYNDKLNAFVRYEPRGGRWWADYSVRHNWSADISLEEGEPTPAAGERKERRRHLPGGHHQEPRRRIADVQGKRRGGVNHPSLLPISDLLPDGGDDRNF